MPEIVACFSSLPGCGAPSIDGAGASLSLGVSALAGAGCSCTGGVALAGSTFPGSEGLSIFPVSGIFFLSSAT